MAAVSNSSPLILYAAIGHLDLLRRVYDEITVPPAVWREVVAAGAGRAGSAEVKTASWIRQRPPPAPGPPFQALSTLDAGEAEAIVLAMSLVPPAAILLDDRRARRIAQEAGLAVTGTAGVLVLAKQLGIVPSVRLLLAELRSAGLYLSDAATERFLALADEQ